MTDLLSPQASIPSALLAGDPAADAGAGEEPLTAPSVGLTVLTVAGQPSFAAVDDLERALRLEAGVDPEPVTFTRCSPTAFHVVHDAGGEVLGVASTTLGELVDVPIGQALRAAGVDLETDPPIPGPVCELTSIAVAPAPDTTGVTEALYRACYHRARMAGAASIAINIEPWLLDILQERYGVPFAAIGPILTIGDRELVPVGGRLDDLVYGVGSAQPQFAAFLEEGLAHRDADAA